MLGAMNPRLTSCRAAIAVALFIPLAAFPAGAFAAGETAPKIQDATPLEWSVRLARSETARLGDSLDRGGRGGKWDYANAVLAYGMIKLGNRTGQVVFRDFGEKIVGSFIAADGSIQGYDPAQNSLDLVAPGRVLLLLFERTGEAKYREAAAILRQHLSRQPRTSDGGFWHKQRYPYQMWLDSMYMGSTFYAEYGKDLKEPADFDDVAKQLLLMDQHAYDPTTGLFYHGWDERHVQDWADKTTGTSPSFWARGIGWYAMALDEVLDVIPADHPKVGAIRELLAKLADGVQRYQDPKSGLWYQVIDQGAREGNYLEGSASSMFVYALAKAVNQGYLPRERFEAVARRGYRGLITRLIKTGPDGQVSLTQCCSGAGLGFGRDGTFSYYVHEPIVSNDPKGVGPFLLAGIEMERMTSAGSH